MLPTAQPMLSGARPFKTTPLSIVLPERYVIDLSSVRPRYLRLTAPSEHHPRVLSRSWFLHFVLYQSGWTTHGGLVHLRTLSLSTIEET